MNRWITLILLVALGLVYGWRSGHFQRLQSPTTLSGNTCEGKEFCVSVYMAPWCPHCKTAVPQVQKMLSKTILGKTGVRVVIGMGQPAQNAAMANSIAKDVVVDNDTKIARQLNVKSVPAYMVLDKDGTVILDGQEAYQWVHEKLGS